MALLASLRMLHRGRCVRDHWCVPPDSTITITTSCALTYTPLYLSRPTYLHAVVQRRALTLEAATADKSESEEGSDVENGGGHGKGAATSQEATRFRCTTKVLALVGLTLAALHRHAVVNGCRMPIGKHFSSGTEGCF